MASITIGVPVYNGAAYLDEALESLSRQDFSDYEIVISDNASTDATPSIIAAWMAKNPRIRLHRQPDNIGALRNFEWLLTHAQSPYFMFAASDDAWSENYLSTLYAAALARPEAGLSAARAAVRLEDGTALNEYPFVAPDYAASRTRIARSLLRSVQSGWLYGLFRTQDLADAWHKAKRFKFIWGQDFIVLLPFLLEGRVTGSNSAVYSRRITMASEERYRPKTQLARFWFGTCFLFSCFHCLAKARIPFHEKVLLGREVFGFANRRDGNLMRILRGTLGNFKRRLIGRA